MITKQRIQRDDRLRHLICIAGDDARVPRRAAAVAPPHIKPHGMVLPQYFYSGPLLAHQYASTPRS